jgi:predicted Zn-dependent protease
MEQLGRLDEAEATYRRLAGAFPTHVTPPYRLGLVLLKSNQPDSASKYLTRAAGARVTSEKGRVEQSLARELLRFDGVK